MDTFIKISGLLVLCCHVCYGNMFEWRRRPYEDDSEFNILAEFGTNITLTCENDVYNATDDASLYAILYWITPDVNVIPVGEKWMNEDNVVLGEVEGTGSNMTLTKIDAIHFGFYYCIIETKADNTLVVVKKAVNYKGPYFGEFMDNYYWNVIVGGSAAGAVFVILALACAINALCCDRDYQRKSAYSFGDIDEGLTNGYPTKTYSTT